MIKTYFTYYSQKFASKWLVLAIDLFIVLTTFLLTYVIRFNFTFQFDFYQFLVVLPVIFAITTLSFLIVGSYKSVIRHTGFTDVINLFKAISLMAFMTIFLVVINRVTNIFPSFTIPLSIIVMHVILSFMALSSSRLLFKVLYRYVQCRFIPSKKILIYGAGDSGLVTYNALINNVNMRFDVVGFIDDRINDYGKRIDGISVLPYNKVTPTYVNMHQIDEIVVASTNIESNNLLFLIDSMVKTKTKVTKVPPIEKWIDGELSTSQIKTVQIEDLLGRVPIQIDNPNLQNEFRGEIIVVTGAAGSIGSELVKQLCYFEVAHLVLIDQAESPLYDLQQELIQNGKHNFTSIVADIRDGLRIDGVFQKYKPTIVFHAAAYKHVPLMEASPYESIKINVNGTKILADISSRYNVKKFVFVSTDKAVNPTSVMGATKRIAEMYISCLQKESKTKFITTRFGNVLGSNGSVIPLFKKQIENGGPLTLTHKDVTRYFMTIPEASQLVLEAGTMGKGGEIFIFDMGESVKIYYLALNMIKLSGFRFPEDIDIKITGLRPGEKLYEELLANGENTLTTYHKKILISKTRELDYEKVKANIESLCITNRFQNNDIVKKMKELLPEYKSNNSYYQKFDKRFLSHGKSIDSKPNKVDKTYIDL